jgi:hypothetical protein
MRRYGPLILACLIIALLVWSVKNQIKENLQQDDPMLHRLKEVLSPIHPSIERLKLYKSDKSYTINKEKIYLCLHDKNGDYYPLSTLSYVLLHEIAHFLNTYDVGHTPKFYEIFDQLLARAEELGIYNPSIPVDPTYSEHN